VPAAGGYVWDGLKVGTHAVKGESVFATAAHAAGLLLPYGGLPVTRAAVAALGKHKRDRHVMRLTKRRHVDANPALLPERHAHAWLGSLVNEASPGQLYNARYITWSVRDTQDMPAYPHAPPPSHVVFVELMAPLAPGDEVLVAYGVKRREYNVAPPPPLSTPEAWGAHLMPAQAKKLKRAREAAVSMAAVADLQRAAAAESLRVDRAVLVCVNAAAGRSRKAARREQAARARAAAAPRGVRC
jgi:hypothetical protein